MRSVPMLTSLQVMAFTSFARILIIRSLNYNKMDHRLKWGHHTRRITITYHPEGSLENLLSKLPNLKIIYFSSQEMFRIHKNTLRWAFPKGVVSKKIQQIILNRVPPDSEPDYLSICRSLRESITHLRKKYPNSDSIHDILDFVQLSHLTVDNRWGEYDAWLLVFPMIDACPKLVEFQYESDPPLPETDAQKLLQSTTYTNKLIYLKSLTFKVPLLTKSYMQYIISYIPAAQLDTFEFIMPYTVKFDQWIQGGGDVNAVLEFASHLSSVKNLVIRRENDRYRDPLDLLKKALQEIGESSAYGRMTRLWQLAQALKGKRDWDHYTASLTLYGDDRPIHWHGEEVLFQVENNRKMQLDYGLDIESYLVFDTQIAGEESVKTLQVTVKGLDLWTPELAQLITNLLTRFTGLQQLETRLCEEENRYGMMYFRNLASTPLLLDGHQEDSITTQNSIQSLSEFYVPITPALISTLSTKLPHLVSLELCNCSLFFDMKHRNAVLDFGNWKQLDTLIINQIGFVATHKTGACLILLEYVSVRGSGRMDHEFLGLRNALSPGITATEFYNKTVCNSPLAKVLTIVLHDRIRNLKITHGNFSFPL